MQDFERYVKSNYHVQGAAACSVTYTYSYKLSDDKASKRMIINHTIKMNLTFLDGGGKQLSTAKLMVINDSLAKISEKECKTISPAEVTNKFRIAKPEIARQLIKVKQDKINSLQHTVNLLTSYSTFGGCPTFRLDSGAGNDIIPQQMKGTLQLQAPDTPQISRSKTTFDM